MPPGVPLVLFDLDGTLLDESGLPAALRATCTAVAAMRPSTTADALVGANTATWQRIWPEVEEEWMLGHGAGLDVAVDAWRETLERCGVLDDATLRLTLATWEREEAGAHRLHPEVPAMLDAFESAGVRLGVVTNGASSVQRGKLAALGLEGRFDPIVISSEVGVAKPHAGPFEHAVAVAGVDPARTWFVGDNLWTDVLGASRAGLRTVWIDRNDREVPEGAPQPDLIVRSLAELPPHLLG